MRMPDIPADAALPGQAHRDAVTPQLEPCLATAACRAVVVAGVLRVSVVVQIDHCHDISLGHGQSLPQGEPVKNFRGTRPRRSSPPPREGQSLTEWTSPHKAGPLRCRTSSSCFSSSHTTGGPGTLSRARQSLSVSRRCAGRSGIPESYVHGMVTCMVRMLGRYSRPWCPVCKGPSGVDCPDTSIPKKAQRAKEKRRWLSETRGRRSGPTCRGT